MKNKLALTMAALGGLLWTAAPARATTNLFVPFSGYRFAAASPSTVSDVDYFNGRIENLTGGNVVVEAPLGHASGGANGFTIYGNLTSRSPFGAVISCEVDVVNQTTGAHLGPWTGQGGIISGTGRVEFLVQATPQGGSYFYTLRCTIPVGGSIRGVRPDA